MLPRDQREKPENNRIQGPRHADDKSRDFIVENEVSLVEAAMKVCLSGAHERDGDGSCKQQ